MVFNVSDEAYYNEDEIIEKNGKKVSSFSGSLLNGLKKSLFLNYQLGKKLLNFYRKK